MPDDHDGAAVIEEGRPIFLQIAELIENDIIDGNLPEESQVPSTTEFAAFYRINPATAAKGVNRLVDDGILYKRRGVGMFVAAGSRATLTSQRKEEFFKEYVKPMTVEAHKLDISPEQLTAMVSRGLAELPDNPAMERSGSA
ncbi:GntR family transcriptional regulator [Arthrobacter pigmenti]